MSNCCDMYAFQKYIFKLKFFNLLAFYILQLIQYEHEKKKNSRNGKNGHQPLETMNRKREPTDRRNKQAASHI